MSPSLLRRRVITLATLAVLSSAATLMATSPASAAQRWSVPSGLTSTAAATASAAGATGAASRTSTTADGVAPRTTITSPLADATLPLAPLTVTGTASDDLALNVVRFGVRDQAKGTWLQPDGTWKTAFAAASVMSLPKATSATWTWSWTPPRAGSFLLHAAPTFPGSSSGSTGDLSRQPGDVSFVITSLLGGASPVEGRIDGEHIGYYGTSFGAMTGLLFYNGSHADPRIDAIVSRMGNTSMTSGGWQWSTITTPLLMGHGDADTVVSFSGARSTYAAASNPKAFLTNAGYGHDLAGPPGVLSQDAAGIWFDSYLKGAGSLGQLPALVAGYAFATLETSY